jgi:hypothetical protein
LQALESSYVQHTESLTERVSAIQAAIPADAGAVADVRQELDAFHAEFVDFGAQIGRDLAELPARLSWKFAQEKGTDVHKFQAELTKQTEGIEKAMSLQEALAMGDPETLRLSMMQKIADTNVSSKYAKDHPVQAAIIEAVKYKALEAFGMFPGGNPGVIVRRALGSGGVQER